MSNIEYVSSKVLDKAGLQHGWFMRYGGVSEGLFESLNGKKGTGDLDSNVDENRLRALESLCHPQQNVAKSKNLLSDSKQISQRARDDNVVYIKHEFKTGILCAKEAGEYENFDAVYTTNPNLVLSQTTADCASVIIADNNHKVVALIHGSWHTLKAQLICDVVAKLKQQPGPGELVAGIGPMICKNCYEFGSEAQNLFDLKYLTSRGEKYLVDLKQMVIDQLKESGVTKIDDVNICTLEDERFFSHRRSGASSGRMLTLACL